MNTVNEFVFQYKLNTSGLRCPEPIMLLHKQMRAMSAGEVVRVMATDPSTQRDIPKFCQYLGHDLKGQEEQDGVFLYWIEKAE